MILVNDPDFALYVGDVLEQLAELADESVHCVVTSPPYWGLRDYGTGLWHGGNPDCDHAEKPYRNDGGRRVSDGAEFTNATREWAKFRAVCGKCGATRVDQQLGLEATPDLFVQSMVEVFREVRRVLRRDGTCWVNLGDSYNTAGGIDNRGKHPTLGAEPRNPALGHAPGLKPKDLCGIPWRVAFALQADGWYLRSDIVWSKPNPMPESVTDRPTKAHEYVFLLTRSPRYFFDADAVREPHSTALPVVGKPTSRRVQPGSVAKVQATGVDGWGSLGYGVGGRNVRSVWEIATQPYPDAHFATFPEALPERCIKAGCPVGGTVLDPFMGSGTTALVARRHGRRSIGIELNPEYAALCARRLQQLSLFAGEPA